METNLEVNALKFTGSIKINKQIIKSYNFMNGSVRVINHKDITECLPLVKDGINWIDIRGLHNLGTFYKLKKLFHIPSIIINNILNVGVSSMVEFYDDFTYIELRVPIYDSINISFSMEQLVILLGKDILITCSESNHNIFDGVLDRLDAVDSISRSMLFYLIIYYTIDKYFEMLKIVEDNIDVVEDGIFSIEGIDNITKEIHNFRHNLINSKKTLYPLKEVISRIGINDTELVEDEVKVKLEGIQVIIMQLMESIDAVRDSINSAFDLHLTSINLKLNKAINTLTIISTIFIPLTFLTGLFGMNFIHTPGIEHRFGFYIIVSLMFLLGLGSVLYFKKRKWF